MTKAHIKTIDRLKAEKKRLKKMLALYDIDSVHTCHEKCGRGACVARRIIWRRREEVEAYRKLAEHYKAHASFSHHIDFLESCSLWTEARKATKRLKDEVKESKYVG
jgi:hypothetical protein